jgi:RNA polymerase-binding protein DksA
MTDPTRRLGELRAAALARLAVLDAELGDLRRDRASGTADDEHDPEGATLSGEWSTLEGLRSATAVELADIDAAVARVEHGTYGVCIECGRDILLARLDARPTATRCIDCAARAGS